MERKTLLQMTKDILEMMESDLVSSINDTLESQMIHREIRNTYMHLMARQEWAHLQKPKVLSKAISPVVLNVTNGSGTVAGNVISIPAFYTEVTTSSVSRAASAVVGLGATSVGTGPDTGYTLRLVATDNSNFLEVSVKAGGSGLSIKDNTNIAETLKVTTPTTGDSLFIAFNQVTGALTVTLNAEVFTPTIKLPNFRGGYVVQVQSGVLPVNQILTLYIGASYAPAGYAIYENTASPSVVQIPEDVSEIKHLKYQTSITGERLHMDVLEYLDPNSFLEVVQSYDTTRSNCFYDNTIYENIEVPFYADKDPHYWTSFDNKNIVVDSYNYLKDYNGLDKNKTQVLAVVTPAWTEADTFIPDMPPQLFPLLVYEAAEACMDLHKQDEKVTTSKRALMHRALQKTKEIRHDGKSKKGFGRRR